MRNRHFLPDDQLIYCSRQNSSNDNLRFYVEKMLKARRTAKSYPAIAIFQIDDMFNETVFRKAIRIVQRHCHLSVIRDTTTRPNVYKVLMTHDVTPIVKRINNDNKQLSKL